MKKLWLGNRRPQPASNTPRETELRSRCSPLKAGGVVHAILVGGASGLTILVLGVYSYALLARTNLSMSPSVPWAALLAPPLLWLFWRWTGGAWRPHASQETRRRWRRARAVSGTASGRIALASICGVVFVIASMTIAFRLSELAPDALRLIPLSMDIPWWTVLPSLVMLSAVAGFAEEIGLRGYFQSALEESGAPLLAILAPALTFTLLHADREWFPAQAAPMFVAAVWYGLLTRSADSIYPAIAVHSSIDVIVFTRYSFFGAPAPQPLSETGIDTNLLVALVVAIVAGVCAYRLVLDPKSAQQG